MDLSSPIVMGVLNVTPDSFSDGGLFSDADAALAQALLMVDQGAGLIDIGGESTRPGAAPVSVQEEIDRVMPVVEKLQREAAIDISLDTSTPELMREGVKHGVAMINDVRAFQRQGALEAVAHSTLKLCVMHMQGKPEDMQASPTYDSVVDEVLAFLSGRVVALADVGIKKANIVLDPGFGFGKTQAHNYSLLKHLDRFQGIGHPLLIGMSRKSMIGGVLAKPPEQRMVGSVAAALLALERGASILRVHDVEATVDAVKVWNAMRAAD